MDAKRLRSHPPQPFCLVKTCQGVLKNVLPHVRSGNIPPGGILLTEIRRRGFPDRERLA